MALNTKKTNTAPELSKRVLAPQIIETKEELLAALKAGELKTSKYNMLSPKEKMLVELVCFGGYTGEQAVRVIDPSVKAPEAIARRMLSREAVVETIEELTVARDKKFMVDVSNARDMALAKLQFIMNTTNDDALAAACAKTILDKAGDTLKSNRKDDEPVGQVNFRIQVENNYAASSAKQQEPIVIEITPEEEANLIAEAQAELIGTREQIKETKKLLLEQQKKAKTVPINPETGLPYTLVYEGINNYDNTEDEEDEED